MSGERTTVTIPKGISQLIHVNEQYFIDYQQRIGQRPELVMIHPSPQ
ncbi:hypothetical protein [Paenibacillus dendrobii]|nr:hypothetical protein [Paenibacillus dendrobii]